jgi:hypothetical protein
VRVNLVVVGDPRWQLTHDGFGIWSRTDADIVALDSANEGFSHSLGPIILFWLVDGIVFGPVRWVRRGFPG